MTHYMLFALNDDKVKPGWIAFGVVLALCVATVLLWMSMNRHLKKISFDNGAAEEPAADRPGTPDPSAPGTSPDATEPGSSEGGGS